MLASQRLDIVEKIANSLRESLEKLEATAYRTLLSKLYVTFKHLTIPTFYKNQPRDHTFRTRSVLESKLGNPCYSAPDARVAYL